MEILGRLAGEAQGFQPAHNGPEKVKGFTNDKSDTAVSPLPYRYQQWNEKEEEVATSQLFTYLTEGDICEERDSELNLVEQSIFPSRVCMHQEVRLEVSAS